MGLYVKSSEPLNVFANLINGNRGAGVAVLQSGQLTRLATNCILNNGCGGVTVEKDCRAELRGNGIYKNAGHGVSFSGNGQIVENDVLGNRGCGIQISNGTDIKVSKSSFRGGIRADLSNHPGFYSSSFLLLGFTQPRPTGARLRHRGAGPSQSRRP